MINDAANAHLDDQLRWVREALVSKLEGLSDHDARRPLTLTGTNLLGLVKHCATWDSRYFGEVFDRPFSEELPRWTEPSARGTDLRATEHESRADIVGLYERVCWHADATIEVLSLDAMGRVLWWNEEVPLFNVMLHCLLDATRRAGHADVLREGLDGLVGIDRGSARQAVANDAHWPERRDTIERAARAAESAR